MPVKKKFQQEIQTTAGLFHVLIFQFSDFQKRTHVFENCQFLSSREMVTRPSVGWGVTVESELFNNVINILAYNSN